MGNIKNSQNNAGLISEGLRFLAGYVLLTLLWAGLGWAISNRAFALVLIVWSGAVAPLFLPSLLWILARLRNNLRKPDLSRDSDLCQLYFRSILRQPGPSPEIWLSKSDFSGFLYFENLSFRSGQTLVLTEAWLAQPFAEKEKQWEILWNDLASQSRSLRLLRRVELQSWVGLMSLFELFAGVLKLLFEVTGFSDLPSGAFWMQMLARRLHSLWLGWGPSFQMAPRKNRRGEKILFPGIFSSVLLGPWFAYNWRDFHPLHLLLGQSDAPLDSSPSQL